MTTLYDLRADDWNEENYDMIKQFFLTTTQPLLTIYFNVEDKLTCSLGVPGCKVMDLTYFLRMPNQIFDVSTFFDEINFGTMNSNIEESMLSIIENVYAPVFFQSHHWPESTYS